MSTTVTPESEATKRMPLVLLEREVLELTGLPRSTWRDLVRRGLAPQPLDRWPGRRRPFDRVSIFEWLAAKGVTTKGVFAGEDSRP